MKQTIEFTPDAIRETTFAGLPAPKDWHVARRENDGIFWERLFGGKMTVIESIATEADGKKWLHVSVAKPNRKIPSYDEVQYIRKLFIGEDRESYMIFPPKDRYVDINPVLHLWTCLDDPDGILPQFEGMIGGKRSI